LKATDLDIDSKTFQKVLADNIDSKSLKLLEIDKNIKNLFEYLSEKKEGKICVRKLYVALG
jgi:dTDP-4-dehydrorhamnose 3,5-epimerase-like enzyme